MQKLRFHIRVALVALVVALFLPSLIRAQAIQINPKKMLAIGTVDVRYQSYNIEMLEVTGGRFWAPYKTKGTAPADTSQTTPEGMPASLYRYRAPIDLANLRLRKLAAALGPVYMRVSGTWANSTFFR